MGADVFGFLGFAIANLPLIPNGIFTDKIAQKLVADKT